MRTLCVTAVAVLAFGLTGCGGGGGDPGKQQIDAMNEMTAALESGDMAKIKAAAEKMKDASAKLDAVKDPAEQKKILEKHMGDMLGAGLKMAAAQAKAEEKMTDDQRKELAEIMKKAKK